MLRASMNLHNPWGVYQRRPRHRASAHRELQILEALGAIAINAGYSLEAVPDSLEVSGLVPQQILLDGFWRTSCCFPKAAHPIGQDTPGDGPSHLGIGMVFRLRVGLPNAGHDLESPHFTRATNQVVWITRDRRGGPRLDHGQGVPKRRSLQRRHRDKSDAEHG